jgi:hypothetical protein
MALFGTMQTKIINKNRHKFVQNIGKNIWYCPFGCTGALYDPKGITL